ncbi:Hsp20/alpha crystallin family protein [Roseibacterium sp. SDUM158017]|uniref:Hsp20/alpha crystallin family protein n=1 Tax=Roseicyclus salinarum TaxID=3036773 RepID=UPI0024152E83|nr:Hsp20/alpha crystallin family protein [Roseibacterium sp. SDUM158017]MDG4648453.1 Hsp20/alpha crystallin family protein [Roseibacterium sp. SDUM158017]
MTSKTSEIEVQKEAAPAASEGWPPILSLRNEIDRLFDDFSAGFWRRPLSRRMQSLLPAEGAWALQPATELVKCDGEYRITAELPGMAAEDIDIKLSDGTITIHGEKSEERKEEKEDYLLSERRYGEFHRTLSLPPGIDAGAVSASFANGVLTVTLPKSAEAKEKERKVEVQSAA